MRPPEIDVTFVLQTLNCSATEDTKEDEPYLWNLGFKVDADTLGPLTATGVPSLGVQVFPGTPFFAHVVGARSMESGDDVAIAPQLGTRSFRLKPALLPFVGWFPGIAGLITLLWDADEIPPAAAEAGLRAFKSGLGPALKVQLDALVAGAFDADLAKDANGNTPPNLPPASIPWRLERLANPAGRRNAVKAIVKAVKKDLIGSILSAIIAAADWNELLDLDDLLGAEAQVYLGNELLAGVRGFDMRFTDDGADYGIQGVVSAYRAQRVALDAVVVRADRTLDRDLGLWRQVCREPMKLYWAQASTIASTTRFSLRPVLGAMPSSVRWFIDDHPLPSGSSNLTVAFHAADGHVSSPSDPLAALYRGGPGTLAVTVNGPVLEVSFPGGLGMYLGRVRALYAYPGDPTLFPNPEPPLPDLLGRGYDLDADLDIAGVEVVMNDEYREDVRRCVLRVRDYAVDRIPVDWFPRPIGPGEEPDWRGALEQTRILHRLVAGFAWIDVAADGPAVAAPDRRRLPIAAYDSDAPSDHVASAES